MSEMQTNLERWLAVPRAQANMVAIATTLTAMAFLVTFDQPDAHGEGTLLRGRAMVLAVVHALFHGFALRGLKAMLAQRVAGAVPALATYRDPRRISHLDLAAAWFGLFALAPYIGGL